MCEIVYNILITNFTVHRCIIRSNAPSNLQMQPLGCIFVYALNCITFGTAIDPCCGSGGMFVQSIKFVEAHSGNKKKVSIYGQEYTNTTFKLAKMNLAIRGISANLGEMAANTFTNDQHKDLKADFIMANPPFNQKQWRAENELVDDPRWNGSPLLLIERRVCHNEICFKVFVLVIGKCIGCHFSKICRNTTDS